MATATMNWVGLTLARDRYQVKEQLGEGGMGFVFRAFDRKLENDVVIKVPRPALLQDPEFAGRFKREIRALVRLEHPHIVKVIDVDEHDGIPFAVMQFLAGGSLDNRRPTGADGRYLPAPVGELTDWIEDVAAALDFVHKKGFVHRDVKPPNILFDAYGNVYLSDFGVAKAIAETAKTARMENFTATGVLLGTPQYMAAEMAMGKAYTGSVDQYALAVTVYEVLSGRLPFTGPTAAAILVKQSTETARPLHEFCNVPKVVSDVVQRALAKEPEKRFGSCSAFAKALLQAMGEAPTADYQPGQPKTKTARIPVVMCPACKKVHRLPSNAWGKKVRCPMCSHDFQAPASPPALAPASALATTEPSNKPAAETLPTNQAALATQKHGAAPTAPAAKGSRSHLLLILGGVAALLLLGIGAGVGLWLITSPKHNDNAANAAAPKLVLGYSALTLYPGDRKHLEIKIERNGYEGPVELSVDDLPNRVSHTLPRIPSDRDTTQLELIVADDADPVERTARVIAKVGNSTLEQTCKIAVHSRTEPSQPPIADQKPRLQTPSDVTLTRGGSTRIPIRIDRNGYKGVIHVQIDGPPCLSEAASAVISGGGDDVANVELRAAQSPSADVTDATVTISTADGQTADSRKFRIALKKTPPPTLASILPITLSPGETRTIDLKVNRQGWTGRIDCALDGLPAGVIGKTAGFEPGQDTATLELTASAAMDEVDKEATIECRAGDSKSTQPITISVQRVGELYAFKDLNPAPRSVAYSNAKTAMTWGPDQPIRLHDLEKHSALKEIRIGDAPRYGKRTSFPDHVVAWTPDGRFAAVGCVVVPQGINQNARPAPQVQLWDLQSGKEKRYPMRAFVKTLAISPNGRWILCGTVDSYMHLWDTTASSAMPYSSPIPKGLDFEFVTFGSSVEGGNPWVGNAPTGNAPLVPSAPIGGGGLPVGPGAGFAGGAPGRTPQGGGFAGGAPSGTIPQGGGFGGGGAQMPPRTPARPWVNAVRNLSVVLGKSDGTIVVWDLEKAAEVGRCLGHSGVITSFAYAPGGKTAVSGGSDRTLRIWNMTDGAQIAVCVGHDEAVTAVAVHADCRRVLSSSMDGTIRLWDMATGKELWKGATHQGAVTGVAVSADGRRALSTGVDKTVRVWALPR